MVRKRYVIGVDVGGTKIAAGVVSPSGKILFSVRVATERHRSAMSVRENILTAIASCRKAYPAQAVGIGITGAVDQKRGISLGSGNLPRDWKDVPLARLIRKRFHVAVQIDNDANAIGLAETRWGKAKRAPSAFILTIGTGIGSAYIHNGRIIRGKTGAGAEFGHTTLCARTFRCSCGHYGHFEALVSGPAMIRLYRLRAKKTKTTHEIVAEAKKGGRHARAVLEEMRRGLGIGIANAIHAFNPHIVVLGGGLVDIPILTRDLRKLVRSHLISPQTFGKVQIVKSSMKHTAGILGGAALTIEEDST